MVHHPSISWAQRSPHIYLTIEVEDMKIDELCIDGDTFKLRGSKGDDTYQADLKFYAKLKGEERRQVATDRHVELIIPKEEIQWWPRLLQEKSKVPWIKVDFNKWVDEDEENGAENEEPDFGSQFPGMDFSSMGMPGANGLGGMNFGGDFDENEDDDETGELEDIEDGESKDSSATNKTEDSTLEKPAVST